MMKKYILIILVLLFSNNFYSQISIAAKENEESDSIGEFHDGLAKIKKNGKWGFVNDKKEIIIQIDYDFADDFSEGLAPVKLNGKYGYIDKTGKNIIPINLNYLSVGSFYEGRAFYLEGWNGNKPY